MRKEIRWSPNKAAGRRKFTKREAGDIAYGALMLMVARMEFVEAHARGGTKEEQDVAKTEREGAELALADLIGQVPANPSLATPEGLDLIEMLKSDMAAIRKRQEAGRRRKLKADHPLAVAHRQTHPGLHQYAMVVMRQTKLQMTLPIPHRSS